jgi:diacylglycerol kinase family enzyme
VLDKRLGTDPWPLILPLPGGTVNNLTHAIRSQSRSPERLLSHVVADLQYGIAHDCADCDLFKVGDDAVGYIFGAGMIVNFLKAYYAPGNPNPLSAATLVLRLVGSGIIRGALQAKIFQPFEADVICDGERVPHRSYRMLIASSVAAIGLGFQPFYLAGRKPGQFHILGGPAKATRLSRHLRYFYRGYPARDPDLYDNLGAEMTVEFARPAYYTVNGDLLGPVMRIAVRKLRRISVIRG